MQMEAHIIMMTELMIAKKYLYKIKALDINYKILLVINIITINQFNKFLIEIYINHYLIKTQIFKYKTNKTHLMLTKID
jgi:hypothetical protein